MTLIDAFILGLAAGGLISAAVMALVLRKHNLLLRDTRAMHRRAEEHLDKAVDQLKHVSRWAEGTMGDAYRG